MSEEAKNSPKTSQAVLDQVRYDYQIGNFKSITELALRYGINKTTLDQRIRREGWEEERLSKLRKIEERLDGKVLSKAEAYLERTSLRMKKYEDMIDASIENLGSKTEKGIPLLDPETIDQFTRSETRIKDISAFVHRIPVMSQTDITSGGKSLSQNMVSAIEKLREAGSTIDITPAQIAMIKDMEIEPKKL